MTQQKAPFVLEAADKNAANQATFIFLHGYDDEAEGLPLGVAQQFQMYNKLPYLRWILPNAPRNESSMGLAWYQPKALPNAQKPRVPGHEDDEITPDDEEGIMKSVDYVDKLVEDEVRRGTDPRRIVVGGFSQGCAISLIWGLTGKWSPKVAGMVCLSGYFPLASDIERLRKERGVDTENEKKWFAAHGMKDMLVPARLFQQSQEELGKFVKREDIEGHIYEGMPHSTAAPELRDLLFWLEKVVPA